MELSLLFTAYPIAWLFVALIVGLFIAGNLMRRFAWIFFLLGGIGLVALVVFALLYVGSYLDAALVALICLLPLLVFLIIPRREKKQEEPQA